MYSMETYIRTIKHIIIYMYAIYFHFSQFLSPLPTSATRSFTAASTLFSRRIFIFTAYAEV